MRPSRGPDHRLKTGRNPVTDRKSVGNGRWFCSDPQSVDSWAVWYVANTATNHRRFGHPRSNCCYQERPTGGGEGAVRAAGAEAYPTLGGSAAGAFTGGTKEASAPRTPS